MKKLDHCNEIRCNRSIFFYSSWNNSVVSLTQPSISWSKYRSRYINEGKRSSFMVFSAKCLTVAPLKVSMPCFDIYIYIFWAVKYLFRASIRSKYQFHEQTDDPEYNLAIIANVSPFRTKTLHSQNNGVSKHNCMTKKLIRTNLFDRDKYNSFHSWLV